MNIRVHIGLRRLLAGPILAVAVSAAAQTQRQPELVVSVGHSSQPSHLAFAGGYLATAIWSDVALIDLSTGLTVARLQTGHVIALEASPVEDVIAVGTCERSVQLWNVKSRRLLHRIAIGRDCVDSVAFSPDGALLAITDAGCCEGRECCSGGGSVQIWDVRSGTLKQELAPDVDIQRTVFSRDGRWLAGVDDKGKTTVFEWPSGRRLRTFGGLDHAGVPEGAGLSSPDGKYLAWRNFTELQVWEVASGKQITQVDASAAEFLNDGRLAYVDEDRLRIVTMPSGRVEEKALEKPRTDWVGDVGITEAPRWLRIHRNGRTIAGAVDSRAVLWDVGAAKRRDLTSPLLTSVESLQWNRPGIVAWGDLHSGVWAWSESAGGPLEFDTDDDSAAEAVAFQGDGRRLAVAGFGSLHILDVQRRQYVRSLNLSPTPYGAVAVSADGSRVAAGVAGGLALFDDELRQQSLIARVEKGGIPHVAFSPDGHWIAAALAADHQNAVKVWPAVGGGDGVTLDNDAVTWGPQPPAFSSDSRWLASFSKGKSVMLWSTGSWKVERTLTLPGNGEALMFAPQGPRLAVAAEGDAAIWDAGTGQKLVTLTGPGSTTVEQIAWSPDGDRVVTASDDGVLRFWNASDGRLLASLYALASTRDWLLVTPDGRLDGSERALATVVAWRTGDRVSLDKRLTTRYRVRNLWRDLSKSDFRR